MFVRSFLILAINNRSHREEMPLYLLVREDGEWRPEPSGGPREDMAGAVTPSGFFVAPRRQPRGPSALARLGMTSRDAVPNEVKGLYGNSDSF
jgi:hypothetical protein